MCVCVWWAGGRRGGRLLRTHQRRDVGGVMRTGEALETLSLSLAEMVRKQSGEPTDGPQQTAPVDLPTPLSVTLPRRLASTRKRRRNSKEIITLYVRKKKKKIQRSRDSQERGAGRRGGRRCTTWLCEKQTKPGVDKRKKKT